MEIFVQSSTVYSEARHFSRKGNDVDCPSTDDLLGRMVMGRVTSEISMSLDGFITDPNASVGTPLEGNDPGRLSDWQFDAKTETDAAIVDEMFASNGRC